MLRGRVPPWAKKSVGSRRQTAATPAGADNSTVVSGLFYGGGTDQLVAQIIGSAAVTGATFGVGLAMMYAIKAAGLLRVSKEGELEGIDLHEHGGSAYPELMSSVGMMPSEPVETTARAHVIADASAE